MIAHEFPPARDRPLGAAARDREEHSMDVTHLGHLRRRGLLSLQQLRLHADPRGLRRAHRLPQLRRRGVRRGPRCSAPSGSSARRRRRATPLAADSSSRPPPTATRSWRRRATRIDAARRVPLLRGRRRAAHGRPDARVDAHRAQPGRGRALRRPDRLAPPRADRAPPRRRAPARRPQPQRRVRERRARRRAGCSRTATRSSSGATG